MSAPAITDRLPVALRAYAGPQFTALPDRDKPKAKARRPAAPASSWTLVFDCETTTDPGQALRFGTYQLRNGDDLDEAGIFYDPEGVTADELTVLRNHADANNLALRTRKSFVDEVFFGRAYQYRATIVGFNLPFDISRLAIAHATARTRVDGIANAMHGGFTFKLSAQKIYPNVRIKHLSQRAALISFAGTAGHLSSRGQRKRGLPTPIRRGHFVDVKTLTGALFARGFSLAGLSRFLKVEHPKLDFGDFDGPVTDEMARYAVRDVQTTWECYRDLKTRVVKLGLTGIIPEKIYSEASIGKAYLREMGIAPWRKCQPDVPRDVLAKIMGSYFGGRSEIRIRRELRQVILCDFLSMYPTACTLMGLWPFMIADGMTWRDATDDAGAFLESVDLAALRSQATWGQLATLVRVLPDVDIFPVRAAYGGDAQSTIGANYLSSDTPLWFTLADCVAAKLLSGKMPKVIETMTFAPGPVQSGLRAIEISGNVDYHVNPVDTDFFKRIIELRQSVKARRDAASGDERHELETEQNALKIAANSTSYGIFIEVNVETGAKAKPTTVHSATCEPFSFNTQKSEMPGTFFHPLLGTLITGAARLMLAIAERLVTDQGLDWSFCDTDSIAIAKPDAMPADEFRERARAVVDWFAALNPYEFGGSILKIEDVNAALETGGPESLYCWTISSKRYALFNLDANGAPVLRKVSAHGLGHLLPPYGYDDAPPELPTPHKSVLGKGIERWHCDLWHQIVVAALDGHPDRVRCDYHPALGKVAFSRYSATTPDLLRWFAPYNRERPYRDQVKPFGFLLAMMAANDFGAEQIGEAQPKLSRTRHKPRPVAPFGRDHDKAIAAAFDRETGEAVPATALKSYADALAQYHIQPESKFFGDYLDRGPTVRRHVELSGIKHIGKESNDWERQAIVGFNADSQVIYGSGDSDRAALVETLKGFIEKAGMGEATKMLSLSARQLRNFTTGKERRMHSVLAPALESRLPKAVSLWTELERARREERKELRAAITRDGLRATARRLGVDASNLRRQVNSV